MDICQRYEQKDMLIGAVVTFSTVSSCELIVTHTHKNYISSDWKMDCTILWDKKKLVGLTSLKFSTYLAQMDC